MALGRAPDADAPNPGEPQANPQAKAAPIEVYRSLMAAYNAGDADRYFAGFTDPLSCFYGATDHPAASLRALRKGHFEGGSGAVFIADLGIVHATDSEVTLLDRGAWWSLRPEHVPLGKPSRPYLATSSDRIEQGVHEKVIVLRRVDGDWRIAAETDPAHLGCVPQLSAIPPSPAPIAACGQESDACLGECDGTCARCQACNACNVCPGDCLRLLSECVGADEAFSSSATGA